MVNPVIEKYRDRNPVLEKYSIQERPAKTGAIKALVTNIPSTVDVTTNNLSTPIAPQKTSRDLALVSPARTYDYPRLQLESELSTSPITNVQFPKRRKILGSLATSQPRGLSQSTTNTIFDVATGGLSIPFTRNKTMRDTWDFAHRPEKELRKIAYDTISKVDKQIPEILKPILFPTIIPQIEPTKKLSEYERELQKQAFAQIASMPASPEAWALVFANIAIRLPVALKQEAGKDIMKSLSTVANRKETPISMRGDVFDYLVQKTPLSKLRNLARNLKNIPGIEPKLTGKLQLEYGKFAGQRGGALIPDLPTNKLSLINKIMEVSPTMEKAVLTGMSVAQLQTKLSQIQAEPEAPILKGLGPILPKQIPFGQKGEGFVTYPTTPALRKVISKTPRALGYKQFEQIEKQLGKEISPTKIKQVINRETGQTQSSKELLTYLKEKYAPQIKDLKIIEELDKKLSVPLTKVKPIIHETTGLRKSIDTIVTNELAMVKQRMAEQAKGAKIGERVGKAEIRSQEALKRHITGLVSSLKSMGDRKLPVEYKDQVDAILEQYDLKARTEVTKEKRLNITEFVDTMREQGDLAFVPRDYFKDYGGKTTLDEMALEDLEHLHNQVKVLATAGRNEGKLISFEKELDLEKTVDDITKTVYQRGKITEPTEEELRYIPPSARKKGVIRNKLDSVSKYFSGNRKVENVTQVLKIWDKVWQPIQEATNTELIKGGEMNTKFKQIFSPIADKSLEMMRDTIQVAGMKDPITRWEAIGVALNSENVGNVERLIKGNQYTQEQIKAIKGELTPIETKFVDDVFKLIDSYWADTEINTIKAVGVRPKKVSGKYFPIKTDYSQDINAQIRESQKDVMKEVFSKAFLERSFTKSRVGGRGSIDLDVLPVILKHLKDVIHYNSFVLPMRDIQKIIHHPKFKKAIIDVMGEATYSEFKPWLADTVNPKSLSPQNVFELGASTLRKNSTAAILGYKVSVSLLQGGSFLQTVHKIGIKSALGGVADFWKNPIKATEWVYSKAPEIKYRSTLWDRELKDWMETAQAKQLFKGLPKDAKSSLFMMIRGIDFITVMPTWIGTYNKVLSITGNEKEAIAEATSNVRTTQPMGSIKDLPRMMRGRPFQKFFTMFKSFYTTMHNQIVDIKDEYRFSDDPAISKTGKAMLGLFWVWIAPALLATWIRSGFKEKDIKKYAKGLAAFPFQGLFLISDLVSSISSGFGVGTPALKAFLELSYGSKGKKPYTKVKHFTKAMGTFTGKPVDALWTFGEGMADLIQGKTSDIRRLVYSKWALGEKQTKQSMNPIIKKYGLGKSRKNPIKEKYGL